MATIDVHPGIVLTFPDALDPSPSKSDGTLTVVDVEVPTGSQFEVSITALLGLGVGLWHPEIRSHRTLPPDWAGHFVTSLVRSAPVLALYDAAGDALWGVACSHLIGELEVRGGVSEEHKDIRLHLTSRVLDKATTISLAFAADAAPLPKTVAALATWLADAVGVETEPLPDGASQPVYSTWYTYTQDVNDTNVRLEAGLAAELGCGSLFIDDGWQTGASGRGYGGTGDWLPDTEKFPDLRATLAALSDAGLASVLWIAPLLLGHHSQVYDQLEQYAPSELTRLNAQVLDPRHAEVRQFVVDTCVRLVTDYGAAGLKIDFLNNAMAYQGTPSTGDMDDVGEAMRQMLAELRQGLSEAGLPDAILEFRQPYVSPAITSYGNCLRVGDCPADAWVNRAASVDLRLFVPHGSRQGAVVHSDPLMWAPDGGAAAVAQQFLSTFFSVPQVSMPLATLSDEQSAAVKHHLDLWQQWSEPALLGDLQVGGVEQGYSQVSASRDGRSVVAAYRPEPLDLDRLEGDSALVLNGTSEPFVLLRGADWRIVEAHAPDGSPAELGTISGGLSEVAVPPFGTITLRR